MVAAVNLFVELDNREALVSVKLLDQHRVVKELVGPKSDRCITRMWSRKDQKSLA